MNRKLFTFFSCFQFLTTQSEIWQCKCCFITSGDSNEKYFCPEDRW